MGDRPRLTVQVWFTMLVSQTRGVGISYERGTPEVGYNVFARRGGGCLALSMSVSTENIHSQLSTLNTKP